MIMKILNFNPINYYDCFFCHKEFISKTELTLFWFCSNSCKYKYAFAIVSWAFPKADREKKFVLTKKLVEVSL